MKTNEKAKLKSVLASETLLSLPPSRGMFILYLGMLLASNPSNCQLPSIETMSEKTNQGVTVIREHLKKLKSEGVVVRSAYHFLKVDKRRLNSLYQLGIDPSESEGSSINPSDSEAFNNNKEINLSTKKISTQLNPSDSEGSVSASLQSPKASGSIQPSEGTGPSVSASYARGIVVPSDDDLEQWSREVASSLASTSPATGSGLTQDRLTTFAAPLTLVTGETSPTGAPAPKIDRTVKDAVDRIRMRMHPGESARFSTLIRLHKGPLTLADVLGYQNAV